MVEFEFALFAVLPQGDFGRITIVFGPFAHNLNDLSDVSTFTFLCTGAESISITTISRAVFGIRFAFSKYWAVIEIHEKARRNGNGRPAGQMIKKKIAQLKITEINLIAHKREPIVGQKFCAGKPGIIAAGTLFKN